VRARVARVGITLQCRYSCDELRYRRASRVGADAHQIVAPVESEAILEAESRTNACAIVTLMPATRAASREAGGRGVAHLAWRFLHGPTDRATANHRRVGAAAAHGAYSRRVLAQRSAC